MPTTTKYGIDKKKIAPLVGTIAGLVGLPVIYELVRDRKRERDVQDLIAYALLGSLGGLGGYMVGSGVSEMMYPPPRHRFTWVPSAPILAGVPVGVGVSRLLSHYTGGGYASAANVVSEIARKVQQRDRRAARFARRIAKKLREQRPPLGRAAALMTLPLTADFFLRNLGVW